MSLLFSAYKSYTGETENFDDGGASQSNLLGLVLSGAAAYIAWKRNAGTNTTWRVLITLFAFIIGALYLVYVAIALSVNKLSA